MLRKEIAPGAWHISQWLAVDKQQELIHECEEWAKPPAGLQRTRVRNGYMSVQTVCLGWHWSPYQYTRHTINADDPNDRDTPVKEMPANLRDLAIQAVRETFPAASIEPDVALINYYDATAKMGLHQDKDEVANAPVVSISLGQSCLFRFGNTQTRSKPWNDVVLNSGDLFVFGGASRLAYHGVVKLLSTQPTLLDDTPSPSSNRRWNITIRESGLADRPDSD